MKKIQLLAAALCLSAGLHAQNIKDANVYPSNLEENMWFEKYDKATRQIKGIHFMVLADGNNSQDITPEFVIKLYLYQKEKDPIFIKTIAMKGLYHMGSKEFKNLTVNLKDQEIPEGVYRLGVFVDADDQIKEDAGDNAMLFKGELHITEGATTETKQETKQKQKETKSDNDGWNW